LNKISYLNEIVARVLEKCFKSFTRLEQTYLHMVARLVYIVKKVTSQQWMYQPVHRWMGNFTFYVL